jgi:Protein of unknown function (DUF2846)
MKKLYFVLFILLTTFIHLQAQSPKATVYLLRPVGYDEYVPYFTYMDQVLLCKLGEGKYSVHEVEPGEHKFHTQYKGKIKSTPETELLVNLEAGKTYYISINITTKAFAKGSFYCLKLSEEEGKKRAEASILDNKCL